MSSNVYIPSPQRWATVDVTQIAQNWRYDETNVAGRAPATSAAIRRTADGINHLLGRQPRLIFNRVTLPQHYQPQAVIDPLHSFVYPDRVDNETSLTYHLVVTPLVNAASMNAANAYAYVSGNALVNTGIVVSNCTLNTYADAMYLRMTMKRTPGAAPNVDTNAALAVSNGLVVLSVSVSGDERQYLHGGYDVFAPTDIREGEKILPQAIENIRWALHQARTTQLPVVMSWSATGVNNSASAAGDDTGIAVANTVGTNLFDKRYTSRNDSACAGFVFPAHRMGLGLESSVAGRRVKVTVRARAAVLSAGEDVANGFLNFVGPNTFADNYRVISVSASTVDSQWFGTDSDFIYLDSSMNSSNTDNRIDVFGATNNGSFPLYVYGLAGWVLYS